MADARLGRRRAAGALRLAAGLAGVAALSSPAFAETALPLLPHRAVYKLTLASAKGSKAPDDATGMIAYDFSGSACAGYKTVFQQVTSLQPAEGDARVSNTETTTLESGDSRTFDFDTRTTVNQGSPDTVKGEAVRASDGDLDVSLQAPQAANVDLKTAALFPTEQLGRIIATASGGGKILSVPVFDGSDTGRKVFSTLAVIGAPITAAPPETAAQVEALKGLRRWPVTVSYFDQDQTDSPPAYVLSFELFENGVSRALKVDYGNFSLAGELVEFEPGAVAPCRK